MIVSHTVKRLREPCMIVSHTVKRLRKPCMIISHTVKRPRKPCMIISHTVKRPCKPCIAISHTVKRPCKPCIVISHTVKAPCKPCIVISHTVKRLSDHQFPHFGVCRSSASIPPKRRAPLRPCIDCRGTWVVRVGAKRTLPAERRTSAAGSKMKPIKINYTSCVMGSAPSGLPHLR